MYRHSIFFSTLAESDTAETWINTSMIGVIETYQYEDEDSENVEVRIFTDGKLQEWYISYLLSCIYLVNNVAYAFNCDDGD